MNITDRPSRLLDLIDKASNVPVCVVWEITLGCNLGCRHCGSRAGEKRDNELSLKECLDIVDQLNKLGTREICLIGGEVFLRKDWLDIVRHIKSKDIHCVVQTGGYKFPIPQLELGINAGLDGIGVSLDGFQKDHDELRGKLGSFSSAIDLIDFCGSRGFSISVNTQISSRNKGYLPDLGQFLAEKGVKFWQLQLTTPMGNASDNFDICVQPYQLEDIYSSITAVYDTLLNQGLLIIPGNNIGYFGPPEYIWRGPQRGGHYDGCSAGINGMGIEADGTVKACPSLPKERYSSGNSRQGSIHDLWHESSAFDWNRDSAKRQYSGYCAECYYKDTCRAGCTWMSDSLFGKPGNNPYCIHRARQLRLKGIKEHVIKVSEANDIPFGTGSYTIVEEMI